MPLISRSPSLYSTEVRKHRGLPEVHNHWGFDGCQGLDWVKSVVEGRYGVRNVNMGSWVVFVRPVSNFLSYRFGPEMEGLAAASIEAPPAPLTVLTFISTSFLVRPSLRSLILSPRFINFYPIFPSSSLIRSNHVIGVALVSVREVFCEGSLWLPYLKHW
jgi:hypothetical protein